MVLEVEDRGPGVPAAERKSIFKPFRRGDQADSTGRRRGPGPVAGEIVGGGARRVADLPPRRRRHRRVLPAGTAGLKLTWVTRSHRPLSTK